MFKDYGQVFENEDIYVNFRVNETRSLSNSEEIAYFSFYTVISAKEGVDINKTLVYYTIETMTGSLIFREDNPQNTNTVTNWKPNILRKTISGSIDETPKNVYLKVVYDLEGATPQAKKELLIKVPTTQPPASFGTEYLTPTISPVGVVNNDYFGMTIRTRLATQTTRRIQLILSPKSASAVESIRISAFAPIENHSTDATNKIPDTYKYVEYAGAFYKPLATFNGDLGVIYEPESVFFEIVMTFTNGETQSFLYKFDIVSLPTY